MLVEAGLVDHISRLRAFDWRRTRHQGDFVRQGAGLSGGVGRAICLTATRSAWANLLINPKRRSTLSIIRSRTSELLMLPVVATQEIASRSQQ
jgi:hypothetical protein